MPKLLFVVNQHPNETLSIPVANRVAEQLRKRGIEVAVYKVPFRETYPGRILAGEMKSSYKRHFDTTVDIRRIENKVRPDLTVHFHNTPQGHKTFKKSDFSIEQWSDRDLVVELAGAYKPITGPVAKRLEAMAPPHVRKGGAYKDYASDVASVPLSRKAGLEPEKFAKALSAIIQRTLKTGPFDIPKEIHGRIRKRQAIRAMKRRAPVKRRK